MKLKRLSLKNFRSFVDESVVDFPDSGLILLDGVNSNFNESSGAGKTSILEAISYSLGMNEAPATDMQSYLTDDEMQVESVWDVSGKELVIKRGAINSVSFDGETVKGAKLTAEKIKQLLPLPADIYNQLSYQRQDTDGMFLFQSEADKKSFLGTIIGLGKYEKKLEELKDDSKALDAQINSISAVIPSLEKDVLFLQEQTSINPTVDIMDLEKSLHEIDTQLAGTLVVPNEHLEKLKLEYRQKLDEFNQKSKTIDDNIEKFNKMSAFVKPLENDIRDIEDKIKKLKSGICFACGQNTPMSTEKLEEELVSKSQKLEKAKQAVSAVERAKAKKSELATEFSEIDSIKQQISSIEKDRLQIEEKRKLIEQNKRSVQSQIDSSKRAAELREKLLSQMAEKQEKFNQTKEKVVQIMHNKQALDESIQVLTKFNSKILQDLIQEVELQANQIISRIPNINAIGLKMGAIELPNGKQSISSSIIVNGKVCKIKNMTSGGQRRSLNLAVDLAIIKVVESRYGIKMGCLFLDEVIRGLGQASREAFIEILNEIASDKTILVIDHHVDLQEFFSKQIVVQYENGRSKINV